LAIFTLHDIWLEELLDIHLVKNLQIRMVGFEKQRQATNDPNSKSSTSASLMLMVSLIWCRNQDLKVLLIVLFCYKDSGHPALSVGGYPVGCFEVISLGKLSSRGSRHMISEYRYS